MSTRSHTRQTQPFGTPDTTTTTQSSLSLRTRTPHPIHPPSWKYDVFLSFRGPETRHTVTDYLFYACLDINLIPFRDTDCLPRGGTITKDIERAIIGSRFSAIVLSKEFADSRYCLDELVTITKCERRYGHKIFPVFYRVDPDEFNQTGVYATAFQQHQQNWRRSRIESWRRALKRVCAIPGYPIKDDRYVHVYLSISLDFSYS